MNVATAPAKRGKLKLALASSTTPSPVDDDPTPPSALPAAPEAIALRWLRRAPENVRHTGPDEDVQELADDMAKHGLLQSLIGYREVDTTYGETGVVMIVGGGRRLQALQILLDRFTIAIDYPVRASAIMR